MDDQEKSLAYLKYEGKLVEDGYLDTRKSANVLLGLDEAIRYFLEKDFPDLKSINYEIPVRIQKGSWEASIPENLDKLIITGGLLWGLNKYFGSALSQMAKNDFENVGFRIIFKKIFTSIVWVIKIATHLKSMTKKKLENLKFKNDNSLIGIPDENENYLYVPQEYLEQYVQCPPDLFEKICSIVEEEREMEIAVTDDDNLKTRISTESKYIFYQEEDLDEYLFPELQHNQYVELEGYVTRANERTNNIGFLYKDHILTCFPLKGNVVDYKTQLFSNCLICGYIDRTDKMGNISEKKPKIKFNSLAIINNDNEKLNNLFE